MDKGKVIFLCGVTSSGKTSIVDSIQNISEEFYYVVANDLMVQMVGDKYLVEDYWKYESKSIYYMYHMAKLLSDMGENVLIDGCLIETPELPNHYEIVRKIFAETPFWLVEVFCPIDICCKRNLERDDRYENQSLEQSEIWAENVEYSFTVNTEMNTSDACAKIILEKIASDAR